MNKNTGDGELDEIINAVQLAAITQNSLERVRAEAKTAIKKYAAQEANKAQQELLQELMESSHEFGAELTPEGQRIVQAVPLQVIQNKLEGLS